MATDRVDCLDCFDCDVLVGRDPRTGRAAPVERSNARLRAAGIAAGLVTSLRAVLFDMRTGNDEALAAAGRLGLTACGGVDLRDPLGAVTELDRLAELEVPAVRFCPGEQGAAPHHPGFRHVAAAAAARGFVLLVEGDVRDVWQPFAGLGAAVVFLDTHFYHLGDFLVLAADEPGFHTSTRLLNSPDALELVAARVGAERLLLGTRTPLGETAVPLLRLERSNLSDAERALVAGGNARRLLAGARR